MGVVVILTFAVVLDAYWQTYRVYADIKNVQPQLQSAKASLDRGAVPPARVFSEATSSAARARRDLGSTNFAYRWVASLPGMGRPMEAMKWGAVAASQEAAAAADLRDLITSVLGPQALSGGSSAASAPIYQNGAINLELVDGLAPRLQTLLGHLQAGEAAVRRIPSIPLPLVSGKIDHLKQRALSDSSSAIALIRKGISVVKLLPAFLGADGTRTYFMAIQNNNDQRATGGSVLGYAIVQFDDGKLKLLEGGGIKPLDLSRTNGRFPVPPAVQWYIDYFNLPFRIKNGMNYTPDFPLVADAWARYVQDVRGLHVDGAIALDPFAIADVLRGQGTMHVPSYPGVVDGSNIVRVAEYDQYRLSKEGQAALPGELVSGAFKILKHPSNFFKMASGLGDAVSGRHLQVWAADPRLEGLIHKLGWDGGLYRGPGDYWFLAYNKRMGGKQDFWTQEHIGDAVTVKSDGSIDSTYTVNVTDDGIPAGEPGRVITHKLPYGVNATEFNLYVPLAAAFRSVTPSGPLTEPSFLGYVLPHGFVQHTEGRYRVFTEAVAPSPGNPKTVTYRYSIPHTIQSTPDGKVYQLTIQGQPLYRPAIVSLTVHLPKGSHVKEAGPGWSVHGTTLHLRVTLRGQFQTRIVF